MPRRLRESTGGVVYHVLNRSAGRGTLFAKSGDYEAFEKVMSQAVERTGTRLLSYCVMPNHWHFVLWPREDGELSEALRWLTVTHAQRWHAHHNTTGTGPVYQGRFKSFPVQSDEHFFTVTRYVERNALRANLAGRAEDWQWSSLWRRQQNDPRAVKFLSRWPLPCPANWRQIVNQPLTDAELEAVRESTRRGRPYGSEAWVKRMAKQLGLEATLRPRGRPRKLDK